MKLLVPLQWNDEMGIEYGAILLSLLLLVQTLDNLHWIDGTQEKA